MKTLFKMMLSVSVLMVGLNAFDSHADYVTGPFDSGKEVTEACIMCHEEAAHSFLESVHWTWKDASNTVTRDGQTMVLGKQTVVNNFCIGLESNWPRCTSCHAGYGWQDHDFDFTDVGNIDCLVCHESTGSYVKTPTTAGLEAPGLDLESIAQSVGPTSNRTCGSCHFYGGGGNNVKHGDLDNAILTASRSLDVHMSSDGGDLQCTACHKTKDHNIPGTALSLSVRRSDLVQCENCHSSNPHESETLNTHYRSVACQTCHIPEFARANPTKLRWDWSTAGQDLQAETDRYGKAVFDKKKGTFVWGKDVQPTYAWYSGESERMVLGDKVIFDDVNYISRPVGNMEDTKSKIYPFKIHSGKQVADKKYEYLLTPQLWKGFWSHFDWQKALTAGAADGHLPYSGEYGFVETVMYWKINHMVAPKEESLQCVECHGPRQTRMDWVALGYERGDPRKFGGRFSHARN